MDGVRRHIHHSYAVTCTFFSDVSQKTCTLTEETPSNTAYQHADLEQWQSQYGGEILQLHRPETEDPHAWVWVCHDGLHQLEQDSLSLHEELDGLGLEAFDRRHNHCSLQVVEKLDPPAGSKSASDSNTLVSDSNTPAGSKSASDCNTLVSDSNTPAGSKSASDSNTPAGSKSASDSNTPASSTRSFDTLTRLNTMREKLVTDSRPHWGLDTTVFCDTTSFLPYHGLEHATCVNVHLGEAQLLRFRPFQTYLPCGPDIEINLKPGTVYILSEHAVGRGWKTPRNRKQIIFRHTIGCEIQLQKQILIQNKVWDERREVHAAENAAREARRTEVEALRQKRLAMKEEEAEKRRILNAAKEQEKLERKQARKRAAEERKVAKEAAKAKVQEDLELKRKQRIEEQLRVKKEALEEKKQRRLEKKRKKKLTDDMFAGQTEVLVRAARLGADDALFYEWLKCSPLDMHRDLHAAWSSPATIPDATAPLGMKTLESTRELFDRYVEMVRSKRQKMDDELIDAGSTQGISPI